MVESLVKDLAYAWRAIRRSPGFFAVAVVSLGLGVGVNTAMFSLVDALLFRPLPVTAPEALVDVFTTDKDEYATSSYPDFLDLQAGNAVFSEMTGYSPMFAPLSLGDRSRIVLGQVVTGNHFAMLGVVPARGRLLLPSDDAPGAARVVVVSHRMWQREFGGAADVVGRSLTLRGLDYSVVGVAPAAFTGVVPLLTPELWMPIAHAEEVDPAGINNSVPSPTGTTRLERRGTRWMFVKGRLKPGIDATAAHANVALLGQQLAAAHPATNRVVGMAAVPSKDVRMLVPQAGGPISMGATGLMAIVGLVPAHCLRQRRRDAAGARDGARPRDWRAAGHRCQPPPTGAATAGRRRGARRARRGGGPRLRLAGGARAGQRGTAPAGGRRARSAARLARDHLRAGGGGGHRPARQPHTGAAGDARQPGERAARRTPGRTRAGTALVDARLGSSSPRWPRPVVLLVVAGLLLRSLAASRDAAVGFEPRGLAAVAFDTDMMRYEPARGLQFWREALTRVRALPAVTSAGLVSPTLPFTVNFNSGEFQIDDRHYADAADGESIENVAVSPSYLATLGLRVLDGRDIDGTDIEGAPDTVVVNDTAARQFWPNRSALGHTITHAATRRTYRVVGVVSDARQHGVLEAAAPFAYFAQAQRPTRYNYLLVRTSGDAALMVETLRGELRAMAPGIVFMASHTMEQAMVATLMPARVGALLAAGFGILGTLLAAIGLYGVVAFSVARRTKEIGVRMALGAEPSSVLTMMLGQGFTLVAAGLVVGALLAAAVARVIGGLLYGVTPADPVAWSAAVGALLLAALLANAVPARRAMRVEPLTALRTD